MFEIPEIGTYSQSLEHELTFLIHHLIRNIIILKVIGSCVHYAESSGIGSCPSFALLRRGIDKSYEIILRPLEPLHPVVHFTCVAMLEHYRATVSTSVGGNDDGSAAESLE